MSKIYNAVDESEEETMEEILQNRSQIVPKEYGCEILLEDTTVDKTMDLSFPNDAFLVWYNSDGKECLDLTRCHKVSNIFDMYYDKYGKDGIKKITFGYGRTSPKFWGVKPVEKKKRR